MVSHTLPLIPRPDEHEYFQRRYGLDPWHNKDTRNLTGTQTVTTAMIAELLVKKAFVECSLKEPIGRIDTNLIERISESTGVAVAQVEEILQKNYPYGSIGAFMADYFELAFKGTEKCRQFEEATAAIFRNVFGFDSRWLGSAWSGKEVPDVLLVSGTYGYQAIIDTKAYSCYDLPSTHRDRMIHHYLPNIAAYSDSNLPVAFFSYIAGGFSNSIANPLAKVTEETGVPGSAMTVGAFIRLCEQHALAPYSHADIKDIFSVGRKVELSDLDMAGNLMAAERPQD